MQAASDGGSARVVRGEQTSSSSSTSLRMINRPKPAVAAAKVMNIKWGMPGTKPKAVRMMAEMKRADGLASWLPACSEMDSEVVTRVTMMAVASDNKRDGICATKPSPMVSRV